MGVTTTAIICGYKLKEGFRLRASWSLGEVKEIQAPVVKAVYVSGNEYSARLFSLIQQQV